MSNLIRPKRTSTPGAHPPIDPAQEGVIYLNKADLQFGFHNDQGVPTDLLAVRHYSSHSAYKANDVVLRSGKLLRALVDIPAGQPFVSVRWVDLTDGVAGGGAGAGAGALNIPPPVAGNRGQALIATGTAQAAWGAEFNDMTQEIFGGFF